MMHIRSYADDLESLTVTLRRKAYVVRLSVYNVSIVQCILYTVQRNCILWYTYGIYTIERIHINHLSAQFILEYRYSNSLYNLVYNIDICYSLASNVYYSSYIITKSALYVLRKSIYIYIYIYNIMDFWFTPLD